MSVRRRYDFGEGRNASSSVEERDSGATAGRRRMLSNEETERHAQRQCRSLGVEIIHEKTR